MCENRNGFEPTDVQEGFRTYLATALWTGMYEPADSWAEEPPEPLDEYVDSIDDIPQDVREELRTDWEDFLAAHEDDVREFMRVTGTDLGQVAHNFHLTRNGHGAGFWDCGAGDVGEVLTKASKPYGPAELMGCPDEDGGVSIWMSN